MLLFLISHLNLDGHNQSFPDQFSSIDNIGHPAGTGNSGYFENPNEGGAGTMKYEIFNNNNLQLKIYHTDE